MRPKIQDFEAACERARGNLTKVAEAFGVDRVTVYNWCKANPKFQRAIDNQRGKTLDILLNTAVSLAQGIPKIKDGKRVGWKEEPNTKVLTYLIGKYGAKEGFGEKVDITSNGESIKPDPVTIRFVADREQLAQIEAEVPDVKE